MNYNLYQNDFYIHTTILRITTGQSSLIKPLKNVDYWAYSVKVYVLYDSVYDITLSQKQWQSMVYSGNDFV